MAGTSKKTIEETFTKRIAPLREKLADAQETVRLTSAQIEALEATMDELLGAADEGGES